MRFRLLHYIIFAAAFTAAGCYDSGFGSDGGSSQEPLSTMSIAELRAIYASTPQTITGDIIISGRVTTNDATGNFYRTFCIEENGAAIEIMAGIDHLHNDFPEGSKVSLRLRGLTLGQSYGVLQAGRAPSPGSGFETDYIGSKPALDAVLTRSSEPISRIPAANMSISELNPALCGTLVRIDALRLSYEGETENIWAGYRRFTDTNGNEVYSYVRNYADFADRYVPEAECSLTGILQYSSSGGRYIIKLRNEQDCAF